MVNLVLNLDLREDIIIKKEMKKQIKLKPIKQKTDVEAKVIMNRKLKMKKKKE